MLPEETVMWCLNAKGTNVLIVTDALKERVAMRLFFAASGIAEPILLKFKSWQGRLRCPKTLCNVIDSLKHNDSILLVTEGRFALTDDPLMYSLKKGTKIAVMYKITEDILDRCINVDYHKLKTETERIAQMFTKGEEIRVKTELGTDIVLNVEGREGKTCNGSFEPGSRRNLPAGEAFIAPISAQGKVVIDGTIGGFGAVDRPVTWHVRDGIVSKITGGKTAIKLAGYIERIENADRIAEFGIGLNPKAKICGMILEDEKALGTAHIAIGNSKVVGGDVECITHIDGVIKNPQIFVDGKELKLGK